MSGAAGSNHTMRALTQLRQRILSGELQGGERLLEVPLAAMLQISRTPVREAMSRLAEEGLLERGSSGGFIVRAFGLDDVFDAIELRGVLEGTAARLAAERGIGRDALAGISAIVGELDTCLEAQRNVFDLQNYSRLNARFHEALSHLSGSKIISGELERVNHLPFASPSAFLPGNSELDVGWRSLDTAQAQHRGIVAAIAAREGSRAEALAREHARTARRDLEYVMKQKRSERGAMAEFALIVS